MYSPVLFLRYSLLALGLFIAGAGLLIYVAFVLSPSNSLDAFRNNLESIVTRLRTQTGARLALLSSSPLGSPSASEINQVIDQYNRLTRLPGAVRAVDAAGTRRLSIA
jgi:hypothetical protein